ncbi:unnamed protein product [Closterium sp. NIES-53]
MTTRTTDAVADGSTASVIFATRADTCGAIATNSLMDGLLLKAKRVEEQEDGEEEAVEAVVVAEVVLQPSPVKHVTSALGQQAEVKGMGKAMFKGADGKMVGLKNVLWVPNLAANLISVRRLQKAGMDTSLKGAKTYTARLGERILWDLHEDRDVYNEMWQIPVVPMSKERQVAASISTKASEYEESGASAKEQHKGEENPKAVAKEEYGENMWGTIASAAFSNLTSATGECDWLTLHRRMGHVALPILQQLVKDEMFGGNGKASLDEVVMDVVGPLKLGAARPEYFLTIVDVYTRMTWVYVLSKKSDVAETVKTDWLPMVERQQDRLVKEIRTDRGGEFLSKDFSLWLKKNGIRHSLTMPYSPAMNGIAKRASRTITETARGLLIEAGLPDYFWPDAVRSACVAKNRALTHVGAEKWVPYVEWVGRKPKVDMIRVFRCMCMTLVPKHLRHNKLGAKAIWAVHLGMAQNSKEWLLWDPFTKKFLLSSGSTTTRQSSLVNGGEEAKDAEEEEEEVQQVSERAPTLPSRTTSAPRIRVLEGAGARDPTESGATAAGGSDAGAGGAGVEGPGVRGAGAGGAGAVDPARRVPRSRPPPVPGTHAMTLHSSSVPLHVPLPALPESSLYEVPDPESDCARAASPTVSRLLATVVTDPSFQSAAASALVAELLDFVDACRLDYTTALVAESPLPEDFECLAAAVPRFASMLLALEGDPDAADIPTPRSYAEVITGPYSSQWQAAMDAEMASWKSTGTYVNEVPPPGANIVDGMWIFRSDYELHSLDFSTAFLQGSLHEEIWLRRPPGFTESFPAGTQWSLRRPVYGLHQAPRKWHNTLRTTLAALGFAPSTADPSLFLRTDTSLPPFYVLVYVDDLVFATADNEALTLVKSELQKRHTCTDLGELRSYLCLEITRERARRTITLTQSHMVHQVLQRFSFQFSSPQPTPLSTSHSLSAPPSDESIEPSGPYLELVGCLMYLMTCTRPDRAYPLSLLAHFVAPDSCEAEIYAGAMASQDSRWLTYLLSDLGEQPCSPPVLCSSVASFLAYVATRANTADIFTKALPPGDHQRFSTVLGLLALLFLTSLVTAFSQVQISSIPHHIPGFQCVLWKWDVLGTAWGNPYLVVMPDIMHQADLGIMSHIVPVVRKMKKRRVKQMDRTAQALYDVVVARYSSPATAALGLLLLPYLFSELSAFATVEDLVSHLRASDARYRAATPAQFLDRNQPPMFITLSFIVTRLLDSLRFVRDHFLSLDPTSLTVDLLEQHLLAAETSAVADIAATSTSAKRRSSKGKGGRGGGGGSGGGGGGRRGSGGGSSGGGGSGGTGVIV